MSSDGEPNISDGRSHEVVSNSDLLNFSGLLLIGVLVTIIISSESSISVEITCVGLVLGGVLNPVVHSFSEDDELEAVMGCASVPRKGTVTLEELLFFFDWLVETGKVSVWNNFHFSDEFVSSVNSTVLCCCFS